MTSLLGLALTDPNVPTPSFVIEEERLDKNLRRALDQARRLGVTLRPHLKTHKSIGIALRQMETPQGPACVSTLLEAEYFFSHGVNAVTTQAKAKERHSFWYEKAADQGDEYAAARLKVLSQPVQPVQERYPAHAVSGS